MANIQRLLQGEEFWQSLRVGLVFTAATVALQVVMGMAVALLLHQPFRGRGLASALALFPFIWFGTARMAMVSVVPVNVWQFSPFVVVTLLARLTTSPEEQYEAARIDGASAPQVFWFVTLPHLKTILAVVILPAHAVRGPAAPSHRSW